MKSCPTPKPPAGSLEHQAGSRERAAESLDHSSGSGTLEPVPSAVNPDFPDTDGVDRDTAASGTRRRRSAADRPRPQWKLLRLARWTIPLHVALPVGLSWLIQNDPDTALTAFWSVHAGFPALLLASVRWWWPLKDELVALLLINHLVSFAVLMFLPW